MKDHLNRIAIAFVAFIALVATEKSAHACYGSTTVMPASTAGTMTLTVKSGQPCPIAFLALGPVPSTRVEKRPAHGAVTVNSFGSVIYKSRPNFVGEDSFSYSRRGVDDVNKPMVSNMQVTVKVVR